MIIFVICLPSWIPVAIMLFLITIKLKILFILKHLLSVIYIHDGTFDKDKKPKINNEVKYVS